MPELSIIVPVYKVEKYLPKCIDSILAQTFRDFELILIDDGSPDNCGAICDEYAARDSRIKVIHQANAGVSAARNAGLDIASGTYLGFVDSDDWIEPEMYATMIATAEEKQVDVVACDVVINDCILGQLPIAATKYSRNDLLKDLFSKPSRLHGYGINKIYKESVVQNTRFLVGLRIWEDLTWLMDVYLGENLSCAHINRGYYHYRFNELSATQSKGALVYNHIHFKKYIFKRMRAFSSELAGRSIDYFLDSSIGLARAYRASQTINPMQRLLGIIKIKWIILCWVVYAGINKLLPRERQNRYLYEGVIKS